MRIGFLEIFLISFIIILCIGSKQLPKLAHAIGSSAKILKDEIGLEKKDKVDEQEALAEAITEQTDETEK